MLGQTHDLAAALLSDRPLPREGGDAVFFDLFGLMVVLFPPWFGWIMLALGAAGYAAAWRKDREPIGSSGAGFMGAFGGGALRMAGLIIGTGFMLALLNWLSGDGPEADYYDRLAAIPKLIGMTGFALAGVIVILLGGRRFDFGARLGAALPLALLAIAAQALAPTAAYFLVIPVMLAGLVELVRAYGGDRAGTIAAAFVAALASGYMLALGFQMMQGVGPAMPWVAALPAALAALGWLPLWQPVPRGRVVATVAIGAAVTMALWVRFDPVPPTVAVYATVKPG